MMKLKFLVPALAIVAVLVLLVAARNRSLDDTGFATKKAMLVMREIGHKLLSHAGDSSSRVLPVKNSAEGMFTLEFQSSFSFMPDSLVSIVRKAIADNGISDQYMVNVYECATSQIVYGFAIAPRQNNIVPCRGRVQPVRCYTIEIALADFNAATIMPAGYDYLLAFIGFCVVGFISGSYFRKEKKILTADADDAAVSVCVNIGSYSFYPVKQELQHESHTVELSPKESKLLSILAAHQNQLIARDRLLKEVWEDDGVFTGRSLDMFVSKLRKKFKDDPSIQLVNIHGKGYKLEVATGV